MGPNEPKSEKQPNSQRTLKTGSQKETPDRQGPAISLIFKILDPKIKGDNLISCFLSLCVCTHVYTCIHVSVVPLGQGTALHVGTHTASGVFFFDFFFLFFFER